MRTAQSIRVAWCVDWLKGKAANTYSQFGEDGLIAAVFERIGTTNRQCFEIGAADGRWYSNTLKLREHGWQALLMEAEPELFNKLQAEFGQKSICRRGYFSCLNAPLRDAEFDHRPDFGVIDIDGQDWHMWESLEFVPRVMLIETHPEPSEPCPVVGGEGQAGLDAVKALGSWKGYELVAATYCNALFIHTGAV